MLRFRLNYQKCVEAIDYLAQLRPGITQFYIGKIFFFADKAHLLDYGRPISGDRYVAMEHGPVPSAIYDLIKQDSGLPDEVLDALRERVTISRSGRKLHVKSNGVGAYPSLSGSDCEYLLSALKKYGNMGFEELSRLSHLEPAYEEAWGRSGLNNEMDLTKLIPADDPDRKKAVESLFEKARYAVAR